MGKNGRFEEMTEKIYRKVFKGTLNDDVSKVTRLCGYKFILGLNHILSYW